jgi:hypothetical protein
MFVRGCFRFLIPSFCLGEETVKIGLNGQQVSSLTFHVVGEVAAAAAEHGGVYGSVLNDFDSSMGPVRQALQSSASDTGVLESVMKGVDAVGLGKITNAAGSVVAADIPNMIDYARAASSL